MVNCDFLKHLHDNPDFQSGGEYVELCDINEFLADKKEHLINSAAAAVAEGHDQVTHQVLLSNAHAPQADRHI